MEVDFGADVDADGERFVGADAATAGAEVLNASAETNAEFDEMDVGGGVDDESCVRAKGVWVGWAFVRARLVWARLLFETARGHPS